MRSPVLLAASLLLLLSCNVIAARALGAQGEWRTRMTPSEPSHSESELQSIRAHMADPATSSAEKLEQQGDILRARRMPEDAVIYYQYALDHGGRRVRC